MNKIDLATELCKYAHWSQRDKGGIDYCVHPISVSSMVTTEEQQIVALLHDTLEDTTLEESTIRNLFGDDVADVVVILTKKPGEKYEDYIKRVSKNDTARMVKIADLLHNLQFCRMKTVAEKDIQRMKKYAKALVQLMESFDNEIDS